MSSKEDFAYSNILVQRLVKTVARCFYTDLCVAFLDALIREKYIREEEVAPRLKCPDKDVRQVLNQLLDENLINGEKVLMEDMRQSTCYYIDYQMFVDVVRYRVYWMREHVKGFADKDDAVQVVFKCPTCSKLVPQMEALSCRSKDNCFICSDCCPHDNFRLFNAETEWRLVSEDSSDKRKDANNLKRKLDRVLKRHEETNGELLHEDISELLNELKSMALNRNLPSDNMGRGIMNTKITDSDTLAAVELNKGRAVIGKKNRFVLETSQYAKEQSNLEISFEENDVVTSVNLAGVREEGEGGDSGAPIKKIKEDKEMPDFLQGSGVIGADSLYAGTGTSAREILTTNAMDTANTITIQSGANMTTTGVEVPKDVKAKEEEDEDSDDAVEWEDD